MKWKEATLTDVITAAITNVHSRKLIHCVMTSSVIILNVTFLIAILIYAAVPTRTLLAKGPSTLEVFRQIYSCSITHVYLVSHTHTNQHRVLIFMFMYTCTCTLNMIY